MRKLFYFTSISLVILICSCSAKIGSAITSKQPPLADTDFVLVLQQEDAFNNDGIEIGTIKSGDNGLSVNCTYYEVIDKLKQLARKNGANVIKITEHKSPDRWSSCERLTARIYKVPDFEKHEKEIEWTVNRRLTWEDFKGKPKTFSNPNVAAQTYCGFSFRTNTVTMFNKTKIFVTNSFTCNLSWVVPDQKSRMDLLEHEQGHFDLCEIYTRQLRKKLEEKKLTVYTLKEADIVFKDVSAAYLERQELYEKETNYGLNNEIQKEWTNEIGKELNGLNNYIQ